MIEQSWHEPGVFAALYERHAPHISRYVARRLGDDLADDVSAETFYRAFEKRERYDLGRPDARPWLYGIAANVIAQYHRKETRMLRAFARSGADPVAQTYGGRLDRIDDMAAATAMHQPLAAALAAVLAGLSSAHREVLLLIAWADLSYEETAQALGTSVGTVRSRLHRARSRIRPGALRTAPAAVSARYGNPLVEHAAFGWLPNGLRANGYVADHQNEPDAAGQSTFELRWKYAGNSWADLEGDGLRGTGAELTRTAYRIARSATFGGSRPIAMPLHVGGVPGGLTPKRTVLNNGAFGQVSAILDYIVTVPTSGLYVSIVASAAGRHPTPNGRLDGHPVYQRQGMSYVFGVDGFDVQLGASGPVLAKLNKAGGLVGLFHNVKILGSAPATWTTTPVN